MATKDVQDSGRNSSGAEAREVKAAGAKFWKKPAGSNKFLRLSNRAASKDKEDDIIGRNFGYFSIPVRLASMCYFTGPEVVVWCLLVQISINLMLNERVVRKQGGTPKKVWKRR